MVSFKNYSLWSHTSAIMAMILNVNKDTKKHGVTAFDAFNTFAEDFKPEVTKEKMEEDAKYNFFLMKQVFVNNSPEYNKLGKDVKKVRKYSYDPKTKKETEIFE